MKSTGFATATPALTRSGFLGRSSAASSRFSSSCCCICT